MAPAPIRLGRISFSGGRPGSDSFFAPSPREARPEEPEFGKAGFDPDPVAVRLSPEAQAVFAAGSGGAPPRSVLAAAIDQGLASLRGEAETMFGLLGLASDEAIQAAGALVAAVRTGAADPAFIKGAERLLDWDDADAAEGEFARDVGLIVEEAAVRWDSEAGRYVAGIGRMLPSGEIGAASLVPRGSCGGVDAVIRLDAAVPLTPAPSGRISRPDR